MSILLNFLSRFSSVTIQRSVSYVRHVDLDTVELSSEGQDVVMYAQVEGTDYYDTAITYSPTKDRLIAAECSCPVGNNCKHAAALARIFYKDYRAQFQQAIKMVSQSTPSHHLQHEHFKAQAWLNDFKRYLQQAEPLSPAPNQNYLIYVLTLSYAKKLLAEVKKTRLNKNGKLAPASHYRSYDNIIHHKLSLDQSKRDLFNQVYFYARLNTSNTYSQMGLDLSGIRQEHFKSFIQSGDVYWENEHSPALTWTEQRYQLNLTWQKGHHQDSEKLVIEWRGHSVQQQPKIFSMLEILPTVPPCFIDLEHRTIGAVDSELSTDLLHKISNMPELPRDLIGEFEKTIRQHRHTRAIPQPQYMANIEVLAGNPQAILTFGAFAHWDHKVRSDDRAFAEVSFAYQAGEIKAGSETDHFICQYQGKIVRQQRDLIQEQQAIQRLKQLIPSLKWVKDLAKKQQPEIDDETLAPLISAKSEDWIAQLIPVNQIQHMGWNVEHTPDSLFNIQATQNIKVSLEDSTQQQDWFEVGVTIQDLQGNSYDLVALLSQLFQKYPHLLNEDYLQQLNDDDFFFVPVAHDQPQLALQLKDIRPILIHLKHIFEQDESTLIDRYDAPQLIELQHHLGMAWQTSARLQQFADQLKQSDQQQLPTPQGFQGELRPYQQQGLAWLQFLRQTEHGGILADDMGLGKTAQTLAHILIEKQAGHLQNTPALIVAPTSLMHNWSKEAEKFTPDLKVLILQGTHRHQYFNDIPQYDIVLTTYPLLARDEDALKSHQYHVLILDEAQNIKNPHARAAQVARHIQAKHRLCLTGTPMENHLGELWSLFYFLMPGFLYPQDIFNKKYRNPIEKHGDNQIRQRLVSRVKPFILRRLKTDVAKELPEKTTIEVNIDMNEQQSKLYEAVRATMHSNIREIIAEKGFKRSQIYILDALLKLRQVCCHPSLLKLDSVKSDKANSAKLDHLLNMVTEMVEEGRKILIFSQFTSMLQLIEDGLKKHKIDLVKLTGQTKKREEVIQAFQSGQVPIFLISLKAGGVGLNLTAADTVIHYDPWWNPAAEDQASDRAWRIGQDKPVFVYKLITNQSIEEKILALQKNKAQLAQSILSTDHEGEVKLNEDDVMKLFDGF